MTSDDDPSGFVPKADDAARTEPGGPPVEPMVELNALLGRGTRYAGKLWFEGRIRIEGHFEGEIRGQDVLVIGHGAEVDGDIEVGVCIVTGGRVHADIRAHHAIELHAPAVVVGDLHAPNIFIDRGVTFEGSCKMAPLGGAALGGAALGGAALGGAAGGEREAPGAGPPPEDGGAVTEPELGPATLDDGDEPTAAMSGASADADASARGSGEDI